MTATGKTVQYPRSFGVPWVPSRPVELARVGLSAPVPLRLDRHPTETVVGTFAVQRSGASASICQVDWRLEGLTTDPVLPEHFQGGVLPSGQAFFGAGVVEVPASFLVSPGPDPVRESYGRVVLENPIDCEISPGFAELPLSLLPENVVPEDAVVSLDVPFSVIDPEDDSPPPPPPDYALGPDYKVNWTLQQANTSKSSITQKPTAVILAANPEDAGDIFIFARKSPAAKWKLACKYTWLDGRAGIVGGTFTRFGYIRGKASGGVEADPNLWSAADAGDLSDPTMDANCKGVRVSLNTKNENQPELSNQIRMRSYDPNEPEMPAIDPDGDNIFTFNDSTKWDLVIERDGNKMTFSKSATGKATETVSFTDSRIGAIGEGWLFFAAVGGRRCEIEIAGDDEPPPPPPPPPYTYDLALASYRTISSGDGADLWPSTWALNGNVYTTFGDGPSGPGDVSLGLARFTGSTLANLDLDFLVGGPSPSEKSKFDPIAGWPTDNGGLHAKCTSLIALGGSLYLWLAKGGSNPTGWTDTRLARIDLGNIGAGPALSSWAIGSDQDWVAINPAFVQCGQNFATAWDGYVYALPQHFAPVDNLPGDSPSHNPARFYLIRCLRTANLQTQSNWQWWTGGSDSAPTWGSYANRQPRITMTGQCDWRPSAFYLPAPVNQCLFRIGRTGDPDFGGGSMSRFATFIAQRPWHAWTMIADEQYTATGLDPDLAQISPLPHTLAIDGAGKATWIDTTWGGDNTDKCILAPSSLTPGEAPGGFGLDDFAGNYVMHRDHSGGGVTQRPAGIDLTGGLTGYGALEHCVAIFSRLQWTGDFVLELDITKLDGQLPDTGQPELFLLLLFNLSGLSPNPNNLATWPATTDAASHTYRDGCQGGRLSLYFQSTGDSAEDKLPAAAVFNAGATTVPGTPTTAFEQRRNVIYHYTITKVGRVLTVAQTGGSAARSATYDAAGFASSAAAGNLGFQVTAGRSVRLENLTLRAGGGGGEAWESPAGAPWKSSSGVEWT